MTDLTTIMLWIVFLLGIFVAGHIIGYHRGKKYESERLERMFKERFG